RLPSGWNKTRCIWSIWSTVTASRSRGKERSREIPTAPAGRNQRQPDAVDRCGVPAVDLFHGLHHVHPRNAVIDDSAGSAGHTAGTGAPGSGDSGVVGG